MQISKIVFVMTEEESNQLLSILNNSGNEILTKSLITAKRTVFINDLRPENVEIVNQ